MHPHTRTVLDENSRINNNAIEKAIYTCLSGDQCVHNNFLNECIIKQTLYFVRFIKFRFFSIKNFKGSI